MNNFVIWFPAGYLDAVSLVSKMLDNDHQQTNAIGWVYHYVKAGNGAGLVFRADGNHTYCTTRPSLYKVMCWFGGSFPEDNYIVLDSPTAHNAKGWSKFCEVVGWPSNEPIPTKVATPNRIPLNRVTSAPLPLP